MLNNDHAYLGGKISDGKLNFVLLGVQKIWNLSLGKDDIYKSIINISIYIYYIYKQIIIKDTCTDQFQSSIGNLPTYLDINFLAGGNKHLNRKVFPLEVNAEDFLYRKCPMEKHLNLTVQKR